MKANQSNQKSNNSQPEPLIVSISDQEATMQVLQEAVLELWDIVNRLTKIRPTKRQRYRVTIFGSARIHQGSPIYEDVRRLASELTMLGCDIITGGGPGLMTAANEGSMMADVNNLTESIGILVDLGFEHNANPFVEQVYQHRTFFSRLHHFVLVSDAFVVVPGGIGTTLEAFMIWQLLQVSHLENTPLIMVGQMWAELVDWATKNMVGNAEQLADPLDMKIPHCVENIEDAIALLRQSHDEWVRSNG